MPETLPGNKSSSPHIILSARSFSDMQCQLLSNIAASSASSRFPGPVAGPSAGPCRANVQHCR
eukprot:scaffold22453_cov37-Prasinocladus_malaysianus.AAC.1